MSGIPAAAPLPAGRSLRRPGVLLAGLAGAAVVAATLLLVVGLRSSSDSPMAAQTPVNPARLAQVELEELTGVRIARVAVIGSGGMVDVRYQVVDPQKALTIHSSKPALVDERNGRTIDTQWMPHMMPSKFTLGRTYFLLFVNPDGLLQPGSGVTVELGDGRVEHVLVR